VNYLKQNKGSALIAVLVVLFILLSMFFAIFGLAISRAGILQKEINTTRAFYLADAGINRFLYVINRDSLNWQEVLDINLSKQISEKEEFSVSPSLSGGYILVTSTGNIGNLQVTKKALIGLMPDRDLNAAIINSAENYPLTLAGRTNIIGDVIVGPGSITRGSIEGEAYQNKELVNGRIIQRAAVLKPKIDNKPIEDYLDDITNKTAFPDRYVIGSSVMTEFEKLDLEKPYTIKIENNLEINSLTLKIKNEKISIAASGNIRIIGNSKLDGLIELIAGKSIYIENKSNLNGLILVAKDSIILKNRSVFSGQALSTNKIRIKDSAFINYPSLLYVFGRDDNESKTIEFGPNSYSRAVAVLKSENKDHSYQSQKILVDTNSYVSGYLFSDTYMDIRGVLFGTSKAESYFYFKEPTIYINWLRNVTINRFRLDFIPVLPVTFPNKNGYTIFRTLGESS